MKKKEDKGKMA